MGQLDSNVFGDKTFSDLLEEIYNNQKKRDAQVVALISELKPLVQEIGDATLIVPLIVDSDGGLGISDEEKEALLAEMEKLNENKDKDA
mgnify:CR=1 FL=1